MNGRAKLLVMHMTDDGTKARKVGQASSRVQALQANADALAKGSKTFLLNVGPYDKISEDVGKLRRGVTNLASGLEQQTTKALVMDASARTEFGQLALVNNGEAVVFYSKVCPSKPILEVDGLLVNTDYVVLNETKQSPKPSDIENVIEKFDKLERILGDPDTYSTKPVFVMEELRKFDKVRVVLSGYHYPESLVDMCKQAQPPIYALRTMAMATPSSSATPSFLGLLWSCTLP